MAHWLLIAAASAVLVTPRAQPLPREVTRHPGETAAAFADRALDLPGDVDQHVTETKWDGRPVVFVDFLRGADDDEERPVTALLQQAPGGPYHRLSVTIGETEGGAPDLAALGFANADADSAKELIVILVWRQMHGGGACMPIYEVRILDDAKPGLVALGQISSLKRHFNPENCRRGSQDGEQFPFKTIASVKAELKRMGF